MGKVTVDGTYGCRLLIRYSHSHQKRSRVRRFIHGSKGNELHKWDRLIVSIADDALEYVVTVNGCVTPSEHLFSRHPSVFWIFRIDQMQQISSSVEHIVIQGCVGRGSESFNLSNLSSLITLEIGCGAFCMCKRIVFDSMNDWLIDEWDLIRLQSITLGCQAFLGNGETYESNELIMKSMIDWMIDNEIFLLWLHSKVVMAISLK